MAVGVGAGLCPDSLCDPRRATHPLWVTPEEWAPASAAAGFPDVGSWWRAPSQSSQPLPRAAPPALASSASLEAPWLRNGWEH